MILLIDWGEKREVVNKIRVYVCWFFVNGLKLYFDMKF